MLVMSTEDVVMAGYRWHSLLLVNLTLLTVWGMTVSDTSSQLAKHNPGLPQTMCLT